MDLSFSGAFREVPGVFSCFVPGGFTLTPCSGHDLLGLDDDGKGLIPFHATYLLDTSRPLGAGGSPRIERFLTLTLGGITIVGPATSFRYEVAGPLGLGFEGDYTDGLIMNGPEAGRRLSGFLHLLLESDHPVFNFDVPCFPPPIFLGCPLDGTAHFVPPFPEDGVLGGSFGVWVRVFDLNGGGGVFNTCPRGSVGFARMRKRKYRPVQRGV